MVSITIFGIGPATHIHLTNAGQIGKPRPLPQFQPAVAFRPRD